MQKAIEPAKSAKNATQIIGLAAQDSDFKENHTLLGLETKSAHHYNTS